LIDQIVSLIGNDIKEPDYLLIYDLVDWLKVSARAKDDLQKSVTDNDTMSWQALTTIAMASKQIQSVMTKLNITPEKRSRKNSVLKKGGFDLEKFLNN
jgi:hypothetical protein